MPWQVAIGIAIIGNAITALVQRKYSQKSTAPASFPPAVSYLFGVTPLGIIAGFILPHHVDWSWWLAFLLLLDGSVMALSTWTAFKAVKLLPVAPYQTITRFNGIVTIFLGWVILGEGLGIFQLLGAIILLCAAVLAIWAPVKDIEAVQRKIHTRAVLLTLLSAAALGIALAAEKGVLGHMQIGGCLIFGWGAQTVAMLFLAVKDATKENIRKFRSYEIRWSTYMGLANGTAGVFYVWALVKSNNVSLITALTAVTLPLAVLGAHVFLKERENHKLMWISLGISCVGLLVSAIR